MADKINSFDALAFFARGNPDALRAYYESGADDRIGWGTEGDLTRCHEIASKYMDSEQAWGFCERRAEAVYGESNRSHDIKAGQYPKASASAETETLEGDIEAFCSIDGCSKESHSSGKCITHYQQMRRERKDTTAANAKGKYKN